MHNAIDAAGAFGVLVGLGFDPQRRPRRHRDLRRRRAPVPARGEVRGVRVYDDFAHHPTEISAALTGARDVLGRGRLIPIFQPHLYSRTRLMAGEFAEVFERLADHTIVVPIYGARQDPGARGHRSARSPNASRDPHGHGTSRTGRRRPGTPPRSPATGDILMPMGGGDIYLIIPELLRRLRGGRAARRRMKRPEGFERRPAPRCRRLPARTRRIRAPRSRAEPSTRAGGRRCIRAPDGAGAESQGAGAGQGGARQRNGEADAGAGCPAGGARAAVSAAGSSGGGAAFHPPLPGIAGWPGWSR